MARGRPTSFKPEYQTQIEKLCRLGATNEDIADFFNVNIQTVHNWRKAHPDFFDALKSGKDEADAKVKQSLFRQAIGYKYQAQKPMVVNGQVEVIQYEEIQHPNVTACIFWLKNRKPAEWREKQEIELLEVPTITIAGPDA